MSIANGFDTWLEGAPVIDLDDTGDFANWLDRAPLVDRLSVIRPPGTPGPVPGPARLTPVYTGNPVTGETLGDCPGCSTCPTDIIWIGENAVAFEDAQLQASFRGPSWTLGPDLQWRIDNAAGKVIGNFPRGSYFVKYCRGAWIDPSQSPNVWRGDGIQIVFNGIIGDLWSAGIVGGPPGPTYAFHTRRSPPDPQSNNLLDWLDEPTLVKPPVQPPRNSASPQLIYSSPAGNNFIYDSPGPDGGFVYYNPSVFGPQSKFDAQLAAGCLTIHFYHGGGPISFYPILGSSPINFGNLNQQVPGSVDGGFGFNFGGGDWPTWSLYKGFPIWYIDQVTTRGVPGPGNTGNFNIRFRLKHPGRTYWAGVARVSGEVTDITTVPTPWPVNGESLPLREILPHSVNLLDCQYTSPLSGGQQRPDYLLKFTLDDGSGMMPSFVFDMTPKLQSPAVKLPTPPTPLFGANPSGPGNAWYPQIYLRNLGRGPTTWNCVATFSDNENVTWLDNPLVGFTGHKFTGLPLGGIDNDLKYSFPGDTDINTGKLYSGLSFAVPFKSPPGVTQVHLDFQIQDGPLNLGSFSIGLTLPFPLPS